MYIRNLVDNPDILLRSYICNKYVSDWLQDRNIPVLGSFKDKFVFSRTGILEEVLDYMPLWLKILSKF